MDTHLEENQEHVKVRKTENLGTFEAQSNLSLTGLIKNQVYGCLYFKVTFLKTRGSEADTQRNKK